MLAVVEEAMSNLQLHPCPEWLAADLEKWLSRHNPDADWRFSLVSICGHFGWDADAVRQRLTALGRARGLFVTGRRKLRRSEVSSPRLKMGRAS